MEKIEWFIDHKQDSNEKQGVIGLLHIKLLVKSEKLEYSVSANFHSECAGYHTESSDTSTGPEDVDDASVDDSNKTNKPVSW